MMADCMPVVPKAESILIHSGNIVNWNRLKRKPTQSPTAEILDCIQETLSGWLQNLDRTEAQYMKSLECENAKFVEKIKEEERDELKLTVKVFLSRVDAECIREAVSRVLAGLGVNTIETLLIALPESAHNNFSLELIEPMWEVLEQLVNDEVVFTLGMSDFNKNNFEQLYNWGKVKPTLNQVNLESCCVMPTDMVEFAKENDVLLLTHNDPHDILPVKSFQGAIRDTLTERDAEHWEPDWVLRYSVLVKNRGIIKTKGYIIKGIRDTKKRR